MSWIFNFTLIQLYVGEIYFSLIKKKFYKRKRDKPATVYQIKSKLVIYNLAMNRLK
jgi:hypothetical protein